MRHLFSRPDVGVNSSAYMPYLMYKKRYSTNDKKYKTNSMEEMWIEICNTWRPDKKSIQKNICISVPKYLPKIKTGWHRQVSPTKSLFSAQPKSLSDSHYPLFIILLIFVVSRLQKLIIVGTWAIEDRMSKSFTFQL